MSSGSVITFPTLQNKQIIIKLYCVCLCPYITYIIFVVLLRIILVYFFDKNAAFLLVYIFSSPMQVSYSQGPLDVHK